MAPEPTPDIGAILCGIISHIASGLAGGFGGHKLGERKANQRHEDLSAETESHGVRITRLETQMGSVPEQIGVVRDELRHEANSRETMHQQNRQDAAAMRTEQRTEMSKIREDVADTREMVTDIWKKLAER